MEKSNQTLIDWPGDLTYKVKATATCKQEDSNHRKKGEAETNERNPAKDNLEKGKRRSWKRGNNRD